MYMPGEILRGSGEVALKRSDVLDRVILGCFEQANAYENSPIYGIEPAPFHR